MSRAFDGMGVVVALVVGFSAGGTVFLFYCIENSEKVGRRCGCRGHSFFCFLV